MNLCVVAYPDLSPADYGRIQDFRRVSDAYFHVIQPHFTLIFPTTDWEIGPFLAEVRKQVSGTRAFPFCIRGAALNRDITGDLYHAFLVPDEGHSQLLKLRYRLMADGFSRPEDYQYDFIPHIGVGNSTDAARCAAMVDAWNSQDFAIAGWVRTLDVSQYEGNVVTTIEQVPLNS